MTTVANLLKFKILLFRANYSFDDSTRHSSHRGVGGVDRRRWRRQANAGGKVGRTEDQQIASEVHRRRWPLTPSRRLPGRHIVGRRCRPNVEDGQSEIGRTGRHHSCKHRDVNVSRPHPPTFLLYGFGLGLGSLVSASVSRPERFGPVLRPQFCSDVNTAQVSRLRPRLRPQTPKPQRPQPHVAAALPVSDNVQRTNQHYFTKPSCTLNLFNNNGEQSLNYYSMMGNHKPNS